MNTSLLENPHFEAKKKLSTSSIKSLTAAAPPAIKAVALSCKRTIAQKLSGVEISNSKEKLDHIQCLQNKSIISSN